jgi:transcriptional regulator GlxA family with amidase domain
MELEEKIMLAKDNRERVNIMIPFFEKRLHKVEGANAGVVHIINRIIHTKGQADINKLANDCYLSRRQFERNFKDYSGFSPKLYARIIRFQAATKEYGIKNKSLTEIDYDCGYYDQSHFIHDFKEFSGFHPKEYFHGTPEGMQYRDVKEVLY